MCVGGGEEASNTSKSLKINKEQRIVRRQFDNMSLGVASLSLTPDWKSSQLCDFVNLLNFSDFHVPQRREQGNRAHQLAL